MDQIDAAKDFSYRIGFSGYYGHLTIEPCPPVDLCSPNKAVPDFFLPPAFPKETPKSIKEFIEKEYLSPRVDSEEFSPENVGKYWDFDWFHKAKIRPDVSVPEHAILPVWELPHRRAGKESAQQKWNPSSVEVDVSGFQNQSTSRSQCSTGVSSSNFVKGSSRSQPFVPGGLGDSQSLENTSPVGASSGDWAREVINGCSVESVPCGFHQGLDLGGLTAHECTWKVNDHSKILKKSLYTQNELSLQFDDLFKRIWEEDISQTVTDGSVILEDGQTVDDALNVIPIVIPEPERLSSEDPLSVEFRDFQQAPDISVQQKHKMAWASTEDGGEIANHFNELVPDMAISFPFELDIFQKQAIFYLERGDSVFVAAHTSAGKTVVAEYAFALATKHCTRAVYTAPIKTISNQKYRDFSGKFDVGLLTGDVSLRPDASCLIMTTEILRSMLYKGVNIIRDIEWVIFDEVHYVNDVERGVVWEEVIIMLPSHINIVLLSATVPNTIEFADWIGRTKRKKIFVTGTTKRPVPLEHSVFYSGELYKICESETFISLGLKAAKDKYSKMNFTPGGSTAFLPGNSFAGDGSRVKSHENLTRGKQVKYSAFQKQGKHFPAFVKGLQPMNNDKNIRLSMKSEASLWRSLVGMLLKKDLLPVVIFCFSKNRCDKSANNLYGINLTSSSEKNKIHVFCERAFSRLNGSDKKLPQVIRVQMLLQRGIGVHHAGLLPIVKEVVEMLFCQGLVKVLFSTETFAMGVNAPARTVVFDSLRKFDGREYRQLLPGEYTQMAGRAGRRGIDKIGSVVTMCRDGIPEESDLKQVIVGSAKKLESQFRLTYIMILHLLRIEELQVEDMLKRSFAEFHAQKNLPEKEQLLLLKLSQPTKAVECIKGEPAIEEYYDICSQVEDLFSSVSDMVMQSPASRSFLTPGRVVVLKSDSDHSLGVVLKASTSNSKQYIVLSLISDSAQIAGKHGGSGFFGDNLKEFSEGYMLIPKHKRGFENEYYSGSSSKGSGIINIKLPHFGSAANSSYVVKEIETVEFLYICHFKIKVDIVGILEHCNDAAYSKAVQHLLNLQQNDDKYPPALDPQKDLKLKDINIVDAYNKQNRLLRIMANNKCHGCIKLDEHLKLAKDLRKHKEEVQMLKFQMSDDALQHMPDLYGRIDVLKKIGCIDDHLVVQMKGRVACGMNSGEELICTECLFENHLENLEPEEAVAIMSAFVFQQKNASEPSLTPNLSKARQRLYDVAIQLGELQAGFKLQVDPKEYANENLKFGLVQVVYEWAKGTPFVEICELTDVPEGIIVRTIVRLDETCREFKNAASIMGNCALYKKMEAASSAIRRDIVFAASLYITGV